MPRPRKLSKNAWLSSRWFLIAIAIIFFLLTASLFKELFRSYQINKEINTLKEQIAQLEVDNQEFIEFVEYLKTNRYFEEQARLKLGLKAPGEHVIVLKGEDEQIENGDGGETTFGWGESRSIDSVDIASMNNPKKWLVYFFGA